MSKFLITFVSAVALVIPLPLLSAAETAPARPTASELLLDDPVVARGKGFEIRQSRLDHLFAAFRAERASAGQPIAESARPQIEAGILSELIVVQLCQQVATEADREQARKVAEEFIADQKSRAASPESYNLQLRARGLTPEQLREQVLEQAVLKVVMDRELRSKQTVSEDEVKKFYDERPELFTKPEMVRVAHLLISTRNPTTNADLPADEKLAKSRLADKVVTLAKAGADFKRLVKEYSEDVSAKDRDGEYTITRNERRYVLPAEFEGAAFSLATNQVSELFTTSFGYHILKCLEKMPAAIVPLSEVADKIKENLLQEKVKKELPAYMEKLRKESGVEILTTGRGR